MFDYYAGSVRVDYEKLNEVLPEEEFERFIYDRTDDEETDLLEALLEVYSPTYLMYHFLNGVENALNREEEKARKEFKETPSAHTALHLYNTLVARGKVEELGEILEEKERN